MPDVMTVRGPVDADALGITHLHEHLLSDFLCYLGPDESNWNRTPITLESYHRHRYQAATEHNLTLASTGSGSHTMTSRDSTSDGRNHDLRRVR